MLAARTNTVSPRSNCVVGSEMFAVPEDSFMLKTANPWPSLMFLMYEGIPPSWGVWSAG